LEEKGWFRARGTSRCDCLNLAFFKVVILGDEQVYLGVQRLNLLIQSLVLVSKLLLALRLGLQADDFLAKSLFLWIVLLLNFEQVDGVV